MNALCKLRREEEIVLCLKNLPRGLQATYVGILKEIINDRDSDAAITALRWIVSYGWPITPMTLLGAVYHKTGKRLEWGQLLDICRNLIADNAGVDPVRLIHFSTVEFLMSLSENYDVELRTGIELEFPDNTGTYGLISVLSF